jgi:hypothetical protein
MLDIRAAERSDSAAPLLDQIGQTWLYYEVFKGRTLCDFATNYLRYTEG